MGQQLSTPEKVLKMAKAGDYAALKELLAGLQRHEPGYLRNRARYLEVQREDGSTPLILAAERGHCQVVELLLQQGANIHHMNRKGDGGTALHVAVAHKHEMAVDLLLRHGANPLVENVKGFTAMDIACADKNVTLLRRTEQAAVFKGWLMMKIPRFGGLGSEWQRRWCVMCHRFPCPTAPASRQVTHLVLLAYRSTGSTVPACRVWLDGARAAEVYNPKAIARVHAEGPAQIGVALHRKHDAPAGAFYTGGMGEGFTLYLRPDDGSAASVAAMRTFAELVNNRGGRPGSAPNSATAAGAAAQAAQHYTPPATPSAAGSGANSPRPPAQPAAGWPQFQPLSQAATTLETLNSADEAYARRLQEQYDAEIASHMQNNPQPSPAGSPTYPPIGSLALGGAPSQTPPQTAAPTAYPTVFGDARIPSYTPAQPQQAPAPPLQPAPTYPSFSSESSQVQPSQPSAAEVQRVNSSAPSAPPLISFDNLGPCTAPPQPWWQEAASVEPSGPSITAAVVTAGVPAAVAAAAAAGGAAATTGGAKQEEDDSNICVICMETEATAGFLHGDSVHRCLCQACAQYMKESRVTQCPMCRQTADRILNVY